MLATVSGWPRAGQGQEGRPAATAADVTIPTMGIKVSARESALVPPAVASEPPAPRVETELELSVGLYRESADGRLEEFGDGATLRTGQGYAILVRPAGPLFLYVIQVDSAGKAFKLYPNGGLGTSGNPVAPGALTWIPNGHRVLVLDDQTGSEVLYVVGSSRPVPALETPGELGRSQLDTALRTMGPAGTRVRKSPEIVPTPFPAATAVALTRSVEAEGAFVLQASFKHVQ